MMHGQKNIKLDNMSYSRRSCFS